MSTREGKTGTGTHEYREGRFTICQMADSFWYIFIAGAGIGHAYKTLREARAYARWATENDVNMGSNQP